MKKYGMCLCLVLVVSGWLWAQASKSAPTAQESVETNERLLNAEQSRQALKVIEFKGGKQDPDTIEEWEKQALEKELTLSLAFSYFLQERYVVTVLLNPNNISSYQLIDFIKINMLDYVDEIEKNYETVTVKKKEKTEDKQYKAHVNPTTLPSNLILMDTIVPIAHRKIIKITDIWIRSCPYLKKPTLTGYFLDAPGKRYNFIYNFVPSVKGLSPKEGLRGEAICRINAEEKVLVIQSFEVEDQGILEIQE